MEHGERNLDLRNLHTFDKHLKMFELWRKLKEGEALKIIDDKEPKLLRKELEDEHNGQFEWDYEKEGPDEWRFSIKKIQGAEGKERRKEMIEVIRKVQAKEGIGGLDEKSRKKLENISPEEFARIRQEMVSEGIKTGEVRTLCDVHLEFVKDSMGGTKAEVKPGHPVHTLMAEHRRMLGLADNLRDIYERIESAGDFAEVAGELDELENTAKSLADSDKHHKREDEVLFSAVWSSGITEPLEIIREEHAELDSEQRHLLRAVKERDSLPYPEFIRKIRAFVRYFEKELPDHICKEENILFPMALQIIPEEKWEQIKEECDEVGYCSFTPERKEES